MANLSHITKWDTRTQISFIFFLFFSSGITSWMIWQLLLSCRKYERSDTGGRSCSVKRVSIFCTIWLLIIELGWSYIILTGFVSSCVVSSTNAYNGMETVILQWREHSWVEESCVIQPTRNLPSACSRLEMSWMAMWIFKGSLLVHVSSFKFVACGIMN